MLNSKSPTLNYLMQILGHKIMSLNVSVWFWFELLAFYAGSLCQCGYDSLSGDEYLHETFYFLLFLFLFKILLSPNIKNYEFGRCYICLADYEEGDQIRVLPCFHEYHMSCVDKWLKEIHGYCHLLSFFLYLPVFIL